MGYDVYLVDKKGNSVQIERHREGGNVGLPVTKGMIDIGGTTNAEISITSNYAPYYYQHLNKEHGLRWLHGKKAKTAIPKLRHAIKQLGTTPYGSYWNRNPANAGRALAALLTWAEQYPNATFKVH